MAYLTPQEINQAHISNEFRLQVYHNPNLWSNLINYTLPSPIKIKFDEYIRDNMPANIRTGKGIYMFFTEPNHPLPIVINTKHLLYVGRVQEGDSGSYNFHRRFYSYVKDIGNKSAARNRMRLTNLWPECTFVYYFDLTSRPDSEIRDIESNIINNIVPPLNEQLHGEARLTRQLY